MRLWYKLVMTKNLFFDKDYERLSDENLVRSWNTSNDRLWRL